MAAIVPEVDVAAGRLVIDPPPGLLELAAGEPGPAGPAGNYEQVTDEQVTDEQETD